MSWLYEWLDEGCEMRLTHAVVYFSWISFRRLTVLWPFHYVAIALFRCDHKWNVYRTGPSLIDLELRAAIEWTYHAQRQ